MNATPKKIRTLICGAVLQGFFDLPSEDIPMVLKATGRTIRAIREMPGVEVLGTLDDDETMVGTSPNGWPWTFYILADVPDRETAVAICGLFRTTEVGEHRLWKYMRVEARLGRELVMPE
ncbi:hypothetical protein [Sphingomonas sp. LaA6.9]|uniref:hypothetical protein n=1 Tax=Sphingomonas sp. LaA6.9 TaxID=2919914 RepID=UPI001F4FCE97|nr:hypothetical protein [Sphingomonas sp. LaA6.9]MCJ8158710.1 hypothetical protein [Sphingomonas sp. LaA6.9]